MGNAVGFREEPSVRKPTTRQFKKIRKYTLYMLSDVYEVLYD